MGGNRIISIGGHFYDTGTANKSFLQVALDLKTLGVKNWYFLLEIKDPSLINVDPFSVNKDTGRCDLTKDQVSRITIECIHNMWYYLREIVRIPASGMPEGVPYKANRGNIAQAWCLIHGVDSWLCIPRQQGKTKSALGAQCWAYSFGTAKSRFIFINKDGDNAKTNLRDFADIISTLPEYLRYESIMEDDGHITKETKNATRMMHPVTKNEIIVKPKANSYEAALGIARGLTAPILHFDETEFTPFIDVIVENSVSTYETASRVSKENGTIYGRIFTSTPGDIDTDAGKRAEKLLGKCAKWDDSFYDKTPAEINEILYADDRMGVVYIEYSYRQIGLSEEWFRTIAKKINNRLTVRREILLQRLRGSSDSPYDRDDIDRIIDLAQKPIQQIMLNKYYRVDVYEKLNRSIPYIVGIDCATGNGGDNNAMSIINPYTTAVAAEFECSFVGEPEFIVCIKELVKKHIPRAILCIERNHVGDSIIKFLLKSEIAGRVYFDKFKKLAEEGMDELSKVEDILKKRARDNTHYGVYTDVKSREVMFSILADRIKTHKKEFVGQNVTRDITKLVMKGTKIQAAAGFHDDAVMSYLVGMYVFYYGNNLEVFGFSKSDVFYQDEKNQGLLRPEDVDLEALPESVRGTIESELVRNAQMSFSDREFTEMMRSQQRSQTLSAKGLVENELYENTIDRDPDIDFNYGTQNFDIFDELNESVGEFEDAVPYADDYDIYGVH
jgi:hypothetical protein